MSACFFKTNKKVNLKGAIQIGHSSFFVFKDACGNTFIKNGNDEKLNKSVLKNMIKLSPFAQKILKRYRIKPLIDAKILKELTGGHMNDTCNIAMGVYSSISESIKNQVNKYTLKEASILHDVGKVLIPSKILNKPASLNIKEKKIMNIHSTLGYELLKTQNLPEETLTLIKYHHQNLKHSGYPIINPNDINSTIDIGVQIISIADKYSALRETRVYRKKLTRIEALMILYREVREGKILPEVYNALVNYVAKYDV